MKQLALLLRLQWMLSALVFTTALWWWRPRWWRDWAALPADLRDNSYHFIHYGYFLPLLLALLLWLLAGCPGLGRLSRGQWLWWGSLLLLALWALLALPPEARNPQMGLSRGLELLLAAAFALSLLANPPPLRWVQGALVAGMLFQAGLAIGQSAAQQHLNLNALSVKLGLGWLQLWELPLDPARRGVSIVQSEGLRYLRPYGISPHPNILAGALVAGICAALASWLEHPQRGRWTLALVIGLWALLLSFSRAALGGLLLGMALCFGLMLLTRGGGLRDRLRWALRAGTRLLILLLLLGGLFFGLYASLVRVRAGGAAEGGAQSVEALSIEARAVYLEQARHMIRAQPWRGVGIGNFPWESAYLLQFDWRDLRGDNVHHIYYLIAAELGGPGFALWSAVLLLGAGQVAQRAWRGSLSPPACGLAGGLLAWLAIGYFDHYPWTQFGFLLQFLGLFALLLHPPRR